MNTVKWFLVLTMWATLIPCGCKADDDYDYYDLQDESIAAQIKIADPSELAERFPDDGEPHSDNDLVRFLTNLTKDLIQNITTAQLAEFAMDEAAITALAKISAESFKAMLDKLPPNLIGDIASTPGLLMKASDEHILIFTNHTDALKATKDEVIIEVANSRPHLIPKMPLEVLNMFAKDGIFIRKMKPSTLRYLIQSEEMARKIEQLPRSTIFKMITLNPHILANLPSHKPYPTQRLVRKLINDKAFIQAIPVEILALLAGSSFRHQLTQHDVARIVNTHPRLPALMTDEAVEYQKEYFRNQGFLNSLTCKVFNTLVQEEKFIKRLDQDDLTSLAKNKHLWNCLPVKELRRLAKEPQIGDRLKLQDAIVAAQLISKDKAKDPAVVSNVLRYQVPAFARKLLPFYVNKRNTY